MRANPSAAVVVLNPALFGMHRFVCVAAENAFRAMLPGILKSSRGHLRRHAQPARVQPVDEPRHRFAPEIYFLQEQVKRRSQLAEPYAAHLKTVELVAVNRDVAQPSIFPLVVLEDANPNQMRHEFAEAMVVIALDPHHFHIPLGIGQLANVAEELPVLFGQAGEVEISKNIA